MAESNKMVETIKNAWKIKEIRQKLLFTIFIIFVFRLGAHIPVPFINVAALSANMEGTTNTFMNYMTVLSGGGMQYGAIFAMGVTPYINASIIMNLLTVAIPALERISKQGEEGTKRIAKYTRFATVILGLIQGGAYYYYLLKSGVEATDDHPAYYTLLNSNISGAGMHIFVCVVIVLTFTAGSALMMWLGEQLDEKGIGNGISILLFAGILSRVPSAGRYFYGIWTAAPEKRIFVVLTLAIFLLVIAFIVWMTNAERRIPVQYAKRVVGRKMYGGQSTHIPIKVNMSGVMPVIFASSILSIPTMIMSFMGDDMADNPWYKTFKVFGHDAPLYALFYLVLIIAFAYFYVTIQYNPVEMANNLRKNSGAIPGIRPGKPTSDFISKILSRITLMGALFLAVIAVGPILMGSSLGGIQMSLGGTSVLIVVGVALDTVQNLESQMMMRHYKGFLD